MVKSVFPGLLRGSRPSWFLYAFCFYKQSSLILEIGKGVIWSHLYLQPVSGERFNGWWISVAGKAGCLDLEWFFWLLGIVPFLSKIFPSPSLEFLSCSNLKPYTVRSGGGLYKKLVFVWKVCMFASLLCILH